jgi:hypothetical protein
MLPVLLFITVVVSVQWSRKESPKPKCRICIAEGRPYFHSITDCDYLCVAEKKAIAAAHCSMADDNSEDTGEIRKVSIVPSPSFEVYYKEQSVRLTFDTGATTSLVSFELVNRLNLRIESTSQRARLCI